MLCMIQS